MLLLLGSCLALIIGPLVLTLAGARPRVVAALDGFVLVGVLGLVFLHVIPHAVVEAGVAAMVAACVGILLPFARAQQNSIFGCWGPLHFSPRAHSVGGG